jgi:hypothetical protein
MESGGEVLYRLIIWSRIALPTERLPALFTVKAWQARNTARNVLQCADDLV